MGILEAALDFFGQKNLQNDAQAFSAEQYAKRYQTQVADMKAAGLNPMLSYGQSPGASPSSAVASTRPGSTYAESNLASAQTAKLEADKRVSDATAEGIELDNAIKAKYGMSRQEADLNNVLSQTGVNLETQGKIQSDVQRTIQEISKMQSEMAQIEALIKNLQETNSLLKAQGRSENQRTQLLTAQARQVVLESKITGFNIDAIEKTGGIGRIAREYEPVSRIASEWINPSKWIDKFIPSTIVHKKGK